MQAMSKLECKSTLYIRLACGVATMALLSGCQARPAVQAPEAKRAAPTEPASPINLRERRSEPGQEEPQMLAWYCPNSAAGRPGLEMLMAKEVGWITAERDLQSAVASRRIKRVTVLAWSGHRAGWFSVAGAGRSNGVDLAIGSYQGALPCEPATKPDDGSTSEDPTCLRETAGCAIAIGAMEPAGGFQASPYEEDPEVSLYPSAAACEAADELVIDMDGDGVGEHFSIAQLIGGAEAPVELPYLAASTVRCTESFADALDATGMTRIAVLDVDGDTRPEVLYRRNTSEFLLYGAPNNPARLELLARRVLTSASP